MSFCNPSSCPSGINFCGHSVARPTSNVNEKTRVKMHHVSAKHRIRPNGIHPSFVAVLKHWVENSCDETLVVGSHGYKCRKPWVSEMVVNDDFSKIKSVVIKLIRTIILDKGISDSDTANFLELDRTSKQCTTTNHWLTHCAKVKKKKSCCHQNQETSNEPYYDQNQEMVDA